MSVADSVKVGLVPLYQPPVPLGDDGLSVMVVTGAAVSTSTGLLVTLDELPSLAVPVSVYS